MMGDCNANFTADLLAALDAPGGLWACALDVTEPEPLPNKHPLYAHPRVLITPHTSGHQPGYTDACLDVLAEQVNRSREGRAFVNTVDLDKGY
jgi:phosphoglycerate dehydrogenase-like enzyme